MGIGQLLCPTLSKDTVYLLDFVALPDILQLKSDSGTADLRFYLESSDWTKVMFDPQTDSDALYHLHGQLKLANVICITSCARAGQGDAGLSGQGYSRHRAGG